MGDKMTAHPGPVLAQRDNLTVIDCEACGYAHLDHLPTPDELAAYYAAEFWQVDKSGAVVDFQRQAQWWRAIHSDWLYIAEDLTPGRALLDVGCGFGFFLRTAVNEGWNAVGLDPSAEAKAYCEETIPGISVTNQTWQEYNPPVRFDCISAHWLIEHLPNPLEFLQWCKRNLQWRGVLMLTAPQEWTPAQARANSVTFNKNWWVHKTHLNYFTQKSLGRLLHRAGFKVVDRLATMQMEDMISEKYDYTLPTEAAQALGRELHRGVQQSELACDPLTRIEIYRTRALAYSGRDMILFAQEK